MNKCIKYLKTKYRHKVYLQNNIITLHKMNRVDSCGEIDESILY